MVIIEKHPGKSFPLLLTPRLESGHHRIAPLSVYHLDHAATVRMLPERRNVDPPAGISLEQSLVFHGSPRIKARQYASYIAGKPTAGRETGKSSKVRKCGSSKVEETD
jgi:hypothetical protein